LTQCETEANNSNAHLDFHKRAEQILAVTFTVVSQKTVLVAIVLGFQTHKAGFKNTQWHTYDLL
jgi:hypothetical protein